MRRIILLVSALAILAGINIAIASKESLRRNGRRVYLRLDPVDPRSLMQGDYMDLRYEIARRLPGVEPADGFVVLRIGPDDVASFDGYPGERPLGPDQQLLRYRRRSSRVRFGAESFFFQEGHAGHYQPARYGELRVAPSGDCVLVGLAEENLKPLGPGAR